MATQIRVVTERRAPSSAEKAEQAIDAVATSQNELYAMFLSVLDLATRNPETATHARYLARVADRLKDKLDAETSLARGRLERL